MSGTTTPITDTYRDVEKLIHHVCHLFTKKHGGDFEEWVAEANLVFLDAYRMYDPNNGAKFSTYLANSIYRRLLGKWRQDRRRRNVRQSNDVAVEAAQARTEPSFRLDEFMEQLSTDAAQIVQLVMDAPTELVRVAEGKGGSGRNWSSSIRTYLRRTMGWGPARVREAMDELAGAVA